MWLIFHEKNIKDDDKKEKDIKEFGEVVDSKAKLTTLRKRRKKKLETKLHKSDFFSYRTFFADIVDFVLQKYYQFGKKSTLLPKIEYQFSCKQKFLPGGDRVRIDFYGNSIQNALDRTWSVLYRKALCQSGILAWVNSMT